VGTDKVDGGDGMDTIALSATSANLNAAMDAQIINVEAVLAASAVAGVTIDLHKQTEGFIITGGAGNDTLSGGGNLGNDTFVFRPGFGSDVVTNFKIGGATASVAPHDTLDLQGFVLPQSPIF
jgi:Ca2+-binding RTX toxin-like protein